MTINPEEIRRMSNKEFIDKIFDLVAPSWNALSDHYNQWSNLGDDERQAWALRCLIRAGYQAEKGNA
jgi:hypothetical protein